MSAAGRKAVEGVWSSTRRYNATHRSNDDRIARGRQIGDYTAAEPYYLQALDIARSIGYYEGEAIVLVNLGAVYSIQADYGLARACYLQTLPLMREYGEPRGHSAGNCLSPAAGTGC